MRRYTAVVGLALTVLLTMGRLSAQGPFFYFAGNPANSWYTVGGTCEAPTLTANYLYFISGDVASANLPARWTAFPFRIHNTITFDSISYAPSLASGLPEVRVWITGATTDSAGYLIPDLNNVLFQTSLGSYPGDPPSDPSDTSILTYYGGTTTFLYLRTSALNQSVTLSPGLYFAIIVGD